MRIEIKDKAVHEEEIRPSSKPGAKVFKPFTKRYQSGYVTLMQPNGQQEPYPSKVNVNLDENQPGFEPGIYEVGEESFYVDRNKNLLLGKMRLHPMSGVRPVKAA